MFKNLLIDWVTQIYDQFSNIGQNGFLSMNLSSFNPTLYSYIKVVMYSVVMPVAYVVLALFFILELHKASVRIDSSGGGTSFGAEIIFKVMFRLVLCKLAVDNSLLFMEAVFQIAQKLILGISGVIASGSVSTGDGLSIAIQEIQGMGLGEQIGTLILFSILRIGIFLILGLVNIICISRFLEIYIFIAISPIPLATFPSDELSQIAKNFLKNFSAVCLQGVFIYLILSFFPILVSTNILGTLNVYSLFLYSILLGLGIFGCGRLAKSICNAA